MYQLEKKSPQGPTDRTHVLRQPLAEHSFGKPSSQSLSGSGSLKSAAEELAKSSGQLSGGADSDKTSSQSSQP